MIKKIRERSFFIKETTPDEVLKLLKNFNISKSADIYGISPKLIKIAAKNLKNHIALTFNCHIEQGIFLAIVKAALLYPIHGQQSKFDCSKL